MIGIFDSGIGGLTVVKEIKKQLPRHKLVYFGDTARLPYGTKSQPTILRYSRENIKFLMRKQSKIIVVACNTASALAVPKLRKEFRLPLFDVIAPAVEKAKHTTRNNRIGVIGTPATIASGSYQSMFHRSRPPYRLFARSCPLFVSLVEENWIHKRETYSIAHHYLAPLKQNKIDTLILGCTHYPVLASVIHDIMGREVALINSADELTKDLKNFIEKEKMKPGGGEDEFYVSDEPHRFKQLSRVFLGRNIDVKKISLPLP